jgi:site-specific recombinase XerC
MTSLLTRSNRYYWGNAISPQQRPPRAGNAGLRQGYGMRLHAAFAPRHRCLIPAWTSWKSRELLGHRYVTTTQIYDKRRRAAREGASHKMPL